MKKIFAEYVRRSGFSKKKIRSNYKGHKLVAARYVIVYCLHRSGVSNVIIGGLVNIEHSAVYGIVRKIETYIEINDELVIRQLKRQKFFIKT